MNKRIVGIVSGTRPEIIKLAPVYHALRRHEDLCVLWVHTGQHGEMAADMLRCFGITPDEQLGRGGASLEEFSVACRQQLDALMARQKWDMCIVQGDTESAFLGALAAFYRRIPVGHVEAGLRTYNLERPFPEEGLRQMISRIADIHWAPTERARAALLSEGIAPAKIEMTGNTVVDAQQWVSERFAIRREGAAADGHILVTAHRRENWGEEMEQTFHAVADIARAFPGKRVLFPVHLNPVVQKPAHAILAGLDNVRLVAPFDYLEMQQALVNASLLLTDSGGLQEEAPTFGVPTLVLRHETERPEAVEAGCARIVGPKREAIVREATRLLADPAAADAMRKVANPFGDGQASRRIAQAVLARLVPHTETETEEAALAA
ncbi:non-hydrolyzing UDP-N-acetylglucosamine 2-epimerase [Ramlibacter cellulosilyticus]|uniref:non-hydrolyzing UDP-N-acetylglucosamine 2-epimerase n=1 Tax=Ramlibacter cellulosilyticus TaxID=2764187 RepID=UPI002108170A|nr:UDP-N-acetylglucosamine 2-epimerase (non-hydrolyzing) [Ramlibacter cellulosilyticus]